MTLKLRLNRLKFFLFFIITSFAMNSIYAQTTLFEANFENTTGNNAGWLNSTGTGIWTRSNDFLGFPLGTGSFYHINRSDFGRYPNNSNAILQSPQINLTGKDRLTLSFTLNILTQANVDGMTLIYTNDNGATWNTLGRENDVAVNWFNSNKVTGLANFGVWTGNAGVNGWRTCSIDLPTQGFSNQSSIYFRFIFGSNGTTNTTGVAVDNFKIVGSNILTKNYTDCGLGIGQNLELWLNTRTLTGLADGAPVSTWANVSALDPLSNIDPAWTNATASGTQRPIYYDNPTKNVNFNPVVSFSGNQAMTGRSGFYGEDIFIVINPTNTISAARPTEDVFMGDDFTDGASGEDVTGISINNTSSRYGTAPDITAYNLGSNTGYGRAIVHPTLVYDRPVIFNARLNNAGTGMDLYLDGVDLGVTLNPALMREENLSQFKKILNSRYFIGRSEKFGPSFTGDILEIMSFSQKKPDADRRRIESYLAVKYGITLGLFPVPAIGVPHIPGQYFDSSSNPLWNTTLDNGYTYNVAGIGRDDCSLLNQKQAKSVDPNTFITVGLGDIFPTNGTNPNTFASSGDFLMWGSTISTLETLPSPVEVKLGPTFVTTFTEVTKRTWKFKEISPAGNDIPEVRISVDTSGLSALPALVGNDAYVMIVADDPDMTTNVETLFLETVGTKQETLYDFDGVKYIKFGVAHEKIEKRDILFDGTDDFVKINNKINLTGSYTVSAWVKRTGNNAAANDQTIISKRKDATSGFQFSITNGRNLRMRHNGTSILSNSKLNNNAWYYVSFVYNGTEGRIYIDGILDKTQNIVAPIANADEFTIGAYFVDKNTQQHKFRGNLDEIRVYNKELTESQIRFLMNQELKKVGSTLVGEIMPTSISKNAVAGLNWLDLVAYYNMNTYIGTHLNDASGKANRGSLVQADKFNIIDQTAPLPYISVADGNWNNVAIWNSNGVFIPNTTRALRVGATTVNVPVDWNIVKIKNDVTIAETNTKLLGLFVDNNKTLKVDNNGGVEVSHLISLDGLIDLQGESQLVQPFQSDLLATANGRIEQDQQGTKDRYNYNYWSSPVSTQSGSNNNGYTLANQLKDGTTGVPRNITFTNSSVDGKPGTVSVPAVISNRWLYKYGNLPSGQYSNWQYLGENGALKAGEGFTMKGTGTTAASQNYVYTGRPNNGDINLTVNAGNDYLVGNPYASAIDADKFLNDNANIKKTLYFWEHWGGNTHNLRDYQGGYALYNYSGGVGNATIGTAHPLVNSGGIATKVPKRFIAVGQGFFVSGISTGAVTFRNDQRQFQKESSGNSVFVSAPGAEPVMVVDPFAVVDSRSKFRIGFDSPTTIHRQLLLTIDPNTTLKYDDGYDGANYDALKDDMSFRVEDTKCTIQGIPNTDSSVELPLEIKLGTAGVITIKLDDLENVPLSQDIYLKDTQTNVMYDLKKESYTSEVLPVGINSTRYKITFGSNAVLSNEDLVVSNNNITIATPSNTQMILVKNNSNATINKVALLNMLGQQVQEWNTLDQGNDISITYDKVASGTYIIQLITAENVITQKLILGN